MSAASASRIPRELRDRVLRRAEGRCEYCGIPEALTFARHQIDHIIARKHGGEDGPDNLALSCVLCNQAKGSDIASIDPETGSLVPLFHPRRDAWASTFRLEGSEIVALTPSGRATVRLLQLNRRERLLERRMLEAAGVSIAPPRAT